MLSRAHGHVDGEIYACIDPGKMQLSVRALTRLSKFVEQ